MTVTAEQLLERLHEGAVNYDTDEHFEIMEIWDIPVSQTKALRGEMYEQTRATVILVWGAMRRHRTEVFNTIAGATAVGYMMGRYLLGTYAARPTYLRSDADVQDFTRRIKKAMKPYSFEAVNGALECGNRSLAELVRSSTTTSPSPLDKKGALAVRTILLTSYCLGISMALAEEQVFGPL